MFAFLHPTVPIERGFFAVARFAAHVCGFWPAAARGWREILRFAISCFVVALGAVGENLYGFVYLSNLLSALEAFCPASTKTVCVLKMLIFFVRRENWRRVVQHMRALIMCDDLNDEKRKIIKRHIYVGNMLTFMLLASGGTTSVFFTTLPLVKNMLRQSPEQEANALPFNIIIPDRFLHYPLYPLTYFVLSLSAAFTPLTFSAVDGFFISACMCASGLFRMLRHDIQRLFDDIPALTAANTATQRREQRRKLGLLVERHIEILTLCTDLTNEFTLIIMLHFLSASLVVCFSILDLMLNSASIGVLLYVFYSIAALTQLFLYCIGGTYISESSIEIAEALYAVEWYNCDLKTRKMILMMLRRAQRAKTISVPFFTPSLPAFRSIISTAGSYIALLNTFLNDK